MDYGKRVMYITDDRSSTAMQVSMERRTVVPSDEAVAVGVFDSTANELLRSF